MNRDARSWRGQRLPLFDRSSRSAIGILQQRTTSLLKNPYEKQSLIILLQSVLAYTFHDPFPNFRQGFCGVLRCVRGAAHASRGWRSSDTLKTDRPATYQACCSYAVLLPFNGERCDEYSRPEFSRDGRSINGSRFLTKPDITPFIVAISS